MITVKFNLKPFSSPPFQLKSCHTRFYGLGISISWAGCWLVSFIFREILRENNADASLPNLKFLEEFTFFDSSSCGLKLFA